MASDLGRLIAELEAANIATYIQLPDTSGVRLCSLRHCKKPHRAGGLCQSHYHQMLDLRRAEKHTWPFRQWRLAEAGPETRDMVHMPAEIQLSGKWHLVIGCNMTVRLDMTRVPEPDMPQCGRCLYILRRHGLIAA